MKHNKETLRGMLTLLEKADELLDNDTKWCRKTMFTMNYGPGNAELTSSRVQAEDHHKKYPNSLQMCTAGACYLADALLNGHNESYEYGNRLNQLFRQVIYHNKRNIINFEINKFNSVIFESVTEFNDNKNTSFNDVKALFKKTKTIIQNELKSRT